MSAVGQTLSSDRYAGHAIRGYAYQFDATALEILSASPGATITVEGCEDFDNEGDGSSTAVQCKYHSDSNFSLKGIRAPLLQMLSSFAEGRKWDYRLHVHYSDPENVPKSLTLDQLKESLTEEKVKPKKHTVLHFEQFDNEALMGFIEKLEIRCGDSYEAQQALAVRQLKAALNSSLEDAKDLHYPAAFALVVDLALKPDIADRAVTRDEFLDALDKRPEMYTRWHKEFAGRERYVKSQRQRIKRLNFLDPTSSRMLIIGSDELGSGNSSVSPHELLKALASHGFGIGKLSSARPWTVLLQADEEAVKNLKIALIEDGVRLNDGSEHLQFNPAQFVDGPLINTGPRHSKITATAFDLRLVSTETFEANSSELQPADAALFFTNNPVCSGACDASTRVLEFTDCNLEEIAELLGVVQ